MKNLLGLFWRNALGFRYRTIRILCILLPLSLLSCFKETDTSMSDGLGKYIYRDDSNIYHIDADCIKLRNGKNRAGHEIYAKHPIDTSRFIIDDYRYFRVCSHCVNDSEYEHILRISANNRE